MEWQAMIETDVAALLLADVGVAAIADNRVTPGYLTYDGKFPAIAIRRAAGASSYTFGGGSEASTVLDVVCWGPGWTVARQLAEAARVCLDTYSGDVFPTHLAGREAFHAAKRALVPGGWLVLNFIGAPRGAA
jgi:hypothetical protein